VVAVDGMVIVLPRSTGAATSAGAGGVGPGGAEPGGAEPGGPGPGGRLDDGTPLGQQWVQSLAGRKATRMSSYSSGDAGGYSSRTDVHLCSTGEFAILDRSSVTVDVGGAFGNSFGSGTDRGRWRILTQGPLAGIELQYANGQVERYRLERRGNQTYVEGERWLITPSGACR